MWNSDGRRLPGWVEDACNYLTARIRDREDGVPRGGAVRMLASDDDLELEVSESRYAVEQLLDRGYLYEVEGVLFVTDADE